jgi:kinesin family protein 11
MSKPREDHLLESSSSLQKHPRNPQQDDSEVNIQVVIRCRRRSEREISDNSPIIVSSNGAKSHDVTIETSTPVSSLGIVTLPPTRTYPFDLVFGPEADQAMVYHNVVSPMLDEVLMGYNCTLFAYGQTGTGKTYVEPLSFVDSGLDYPEDTLCKAT